MVWYGTVWQRKKEHLWHKIVLVTENKKMWDCVSTVKCWLFTSGSYTSNHNIKKKKKCFRYCLKNNLCVCLTGLKGIVHPKMKILSSFTPPQVVPNLYECLCSAEHKGRYSEECGTIDLHSIFFFLLWKSMVPQNSLVTNFLQNIFLCVQQNKDIHTGLELLEGE